MSVNIWTGTELKKISGGGTAVDSELSETSENPVQNKVITEKIKEISNRNPVQLVSIRSFGAGGQYFDDSIKNFRMLLINAYSSDKGKYIIGDTKIIPISDSFEYKIKCTFYIGGTSVGQFEVINDTEYSFSGIGNYYLGVFGIY